MSISSARFSGDEGFDSRASCHWLSFLLIIGFLVLVSSPLVSALGPAETQRNLQSAPASTLQASRTVRPGSIQVFVALRTATTGNPYNAVLTVRGGSAPYQFSIASGALAPGLFMNPGTGTISGNPTKAGNFSFQVVVTDKPNSHRGEKRLALIVGAGGTPSPSGIGVSISPVAATVAAGASKQFTAKVRETSNTGVTWSASVGSVSGNGLFTAPLVTSTTPATLTATSMADPTKTASALVTVTASSTPPPPLPGLAIRTGLLPGATAGNSYVAVLSASGGTQPYQWSLASGSLPAGFQLNSSTGMISGSGNQTGHFPFTARVTDAASLSATQNLTLTLSAAPPAGSNFDGPAELPRVLSQSTLADTPAPGTVLTVAAGGNFQAALTTASCGDTIQLQAGATFSGVFVFPAKNCDDNHWIIVRTSAPDAALPPEGTRMTPCSAGVSSLPGRPSFACPSTQNIMAKVVMGSVTGSGPVAFAAGANHYRLIGLEITRPASSTTVFNLAFTAAGGSADHIVFDRVWMHGTAQDETTRGIQLSNTTYVAVVDSFFSDFHCIAATGTCTDAQAINGGLGSNPGGPYKIVNNFLEAAGENVLFGGGGATTTPADIEIRRNHFFKPLIWKSGQPGFVGGASGNPFVVKNHFELKNAQRVLFEGNILENTWGGFSQAGFSILITPKNQSNGTRTAGVCPICQVTDVTIRNNTISHVASGLQIANALSDAGTPPLDGQRYSIHDLVVDDIKGAALGGNGMFAQVSTGGSGSPVLQNVSMDHVTAFPSNSVFIVADNVANPKMNNFSFTNSIVNAGPYPVWSAGGGTSNCAYPNVPIMTFNACFSGSSLTSNAVIGTSSNYPPSAWPAGNLFPASSVAVQFVNFNGGDGGDYHLLPGSPYKGAATDGKDLGADIDAVNAATAGVQ